MDVRVRRPLRSLTMTNVNEEPLDDVPCVNGVVLLNARTNEIVTLRFRRG